MMKNWLFLNSKWLILATILMMSCVAYAKPIIIIDNSFVVDKAEWDFVKSTHSKMPDDVVKELITGVNLMAYAVMKEGVMCPYRQIGNWDVKKTWFVKKKMVLCYLSSVTKKITLNDLKLEIDSYAKAHWMSYFKSDNYNLTDAAKKQIRKKLLDFKLEEIEDGILKELHKKYEVKFCLDGGC